jgi:hypothetical protein
MESGMTNATSLCSNPSEAGSLIGLIDPDGTRAESGAYYFDRHEVSYKRNHVVLNNMGLLQSYPNPFNRATTISYSIPNPTNLSLVIYNILGNPVATVFNGYSTAGQHSLSWQATDLPSGVYVCRLQAGNSAGQMRLVYVK